jgi:uncharacterized membrane protein
MRYALVVSIIIIILSFAISIYLYPILPDKIASHWNSQGLVDGYMGKFWGLFLMPIISVFLLLLFIFIPKIDPLKKNIQHFRKYFDWFIVLLFCFLFYLHLLTALWNLGYYFDIIRAIIPALAILFYDIGILTENAKQNWFIGIRTPWTLSSEKVWDKTHKLGGILFKISAIIALLGMFIPPYALFFVLTPVILTVIYTFTYSYWLFKKIKVH